MHSKMLIVLGAVFGLMLASVRADEPLHLMSYPNAEIIVDGDASDWNLSQFSEVVVGGIAAIVEGEAFWERVTGTGDIAFVGWDDDETNLFYAGMWTGRALPEEKSDHTAKVYARDNEVFQYFLVDITDDEINTGDGDAWANDSVEFYIDPADNGSPTDFSSDTQLVIDASNQVQVWNSPDSYANLVEAGVLSAVTITETGWMLEVGIDKNVYNPGLPAVLGPVDDPAGNNYGIDFSFRDVDDPMGTENKGGDPAFTTSYNWGDPFSGGGFPSKDAGNWGDMIAGETTVPSGDFDNNGVFDVLDADALVEVITAMTNDLDFDLTLDGTVDQADLSQWLADAATTNGFAEAYLEGDANLDGTVNAADLNSLGVNWQAATGAWSAGDFNADNMVNAGDLNGLGVNWLRSIPLAAAAVPEPSGLALATLLALATILMRRKRV